ncbi:MAG: LapA family protein [Gammaproteobacteria bacterium]
MRIISFILIFLLVLTVIAFASLNAQPITLNYLIGYKSIALSWVLFSTFGTGALIGLFAGILLFWRLKRENSRLLHRMTVAEKEVENLRVMPLKDNH